MSSCFGNTKVLRDSEVFAAFRNLPGPVLVTGPSGSGKSYLGSLLRKAAQINARSSKDGVWEVIELDDYGSRSNDGKWVINAKLVSARVRAAGAKKVVLVGTGDNLPVVLRTLKIRTVIMLDPPFSMFKQVMRWKFHDGLEMNSLSAWLDGWAAKSLLKPADKIKYFDSKASQICEMARGLGEVTTFHRIRVIPSSPPERGWHHE